MLILNYVQKTAVKNKTSPVLGGQLGHLVVLVALQLGVEGLFLLAALRAVAGARRRRGPLRSPLGVWPPRAPPPNMEPEDPPDEGVAAAPDDPV